jgi:hypothetical protein
MNRPHHPALVCEGPGEWSVKEWAHRRDRDRIQAEDWPFDDGPGRWGPPAPQYHPARLFDPPHPRSTQARRAARTEHYAAQAALYAETAARDAAAEHRTAGRSGLRPDLVIFDEVASQEPGYGYTGTELHQLMERFARGEEWPR